MASWPQFVFDVFILCWWEEEENRSHLTKATTNKTDVFNVLIRQFSLRSLLIFAYIFMDMSTCVLHGPSRWLESKETPLGVALDL